MSRRIPNPPPGRNYLWRVLGCPQAPPARGTREFRAPADKAGFFLHFAIHGRCRGRSVDDSFRTLGGVAVMPAFGLHGNTSVMKPNVIKRPPKSTSPNGSGKPAAATSQPGDGLFGSTAAAVSFSANEKIFKKGEPAKYLYKVESGCIRTCSYFADGRRRIHAFYYADDYLGPEAHEVHSVWAEAVTPCRVRLVKRTALLSRAARDIAALKLLLHITSMELQRTRNHNRRLRNGAYERIVDFLLDMRERRKNGGEVDLPMSRRDIADYLGLTIETVSRTLTRLKETSSISVLASRRLILHDPLSLDSFNEAAE